MIEVRQYGEQGPMVVLLHGGPGAQGYMAGLARQLADKYRVHEPLQRRAGKIHLTVAQHVLDLHEVLSSLNGPCQIVGSSWGAMLGLTYAARYPENLKKLVLIGCGTFDLPSRAAYKERMSRCLSGQLATEKTRLAALLTTESDRKRRDQLFGQLGAISMCAQSVNLITDELDMLPADEVGHVETWEDVLRLQSDGIQPAEFQNITCPVIMIHGDQDPHPGSMIRDSLMRYLPKLRYHELAHCGHLPWLERDTRMEFLRLLQMALDDTVGSHFG